MSVLIDGVADPGHLSVFDGAVLRGDGCFEAIRSYGGRAFAVDRHYRRLVRSAEALRLEPPSLSDLSDWVGICAEEAGDAVIRVVLTRGPAVPGFHGSGQCVVLSHQLLPAVEGLTLHPHLAPWHPGGFEWELAGVKTVSYAPNQAATRAANEAGFDDALLISREGVVLEGPTFSVAWVIDGVLETPSTDLGILESVTVGIVAEMCPRLGFETVEGRYLLERLERASEVMALSTVKEISPVTAVGALDYEPGPMAKALRDEYLAVVEAALQGT